MDKAHVFTFEGRLWQIVDDVLYCSSRIYDPAQRRRLRVFWPAQFAVPRARFWRVLYHGQYRQRRIAMMKAAMR